MAKFAQPVNDVNSGQQAKIDRQPGTLCYFDKDGFAWTSPQSRQKLSPEEVARREAEKEKKRKLRARAMLERANAARDLAEKLEMQAEELAA